MYTITMKNLFSTATVQGFFDHIAKFGSTVTLGGSTRRNSGTTLPALFRKFGYRAISMAFPRKVKLLSRSRQMWRFLVHLQTLNRRHGPRYVVWYLKTCYLALERAIAGNPASSMQELQNKFTFPRLRKGGLPSVIPSRDARLILAGQTNPSVIRWWSTLFGVFRVIKIPGELKLATITDGLTVPSINVDKVGEELVKLIHPTMFNLRILRDISGFSFLESASATFKVSWLGYTYDAMLLHRAGLSPAVCAYCALLGYTEVLNRYNRIVQNLSESVLHQLSLGWEHPIIFGLNSSSLTGETSVGKLSIKEEPAGKRRVFAMVDSWSQTLLTPLHDMITEFLGKLPNDGTADQLGSVRRCQAKAKLAGKSFGYDLSAATDRVPLGLQIMVLNRVFPGLGFVWAALLDRIFTLKEKTVIKTGRRTFLKTEKVHTVKYAVGQPMGARSSFNMLAVVHHLIVQSAALRAGTKSIPGSPGWINTTKDESEIFKFSFPWYTGYEILGDDVVIFNQDVASEYLQIMKEIGCEINLSKSIIATNHTFEFAKVVGHNGVDVSALPWKAFLSQPTLMGTIDIAFSYLHRDIVPYGRILPYIKNVIKLSFSHKPKVSAAIISLAGMLAGQGRIPILHILAALGTIPKTEGSWFKLLKEVTNIQALTVAVVEALSPSRRSPQSPDRVVAVGSSIKQQDKFKDDSVNWIIATLRKVIEHSLGLKFYKGQGAFPWAHLSDRKTIPVLLPINDAKKVAAQFFSFAGLFIHPEVGKVSMLTPPPSQSENPMFTLEDRLFWHSEFIHFYKEVMAKLLRLKNEAEAKYLKGGDSVPDLLEIIDLIDRYHEITQLCDRMLKVFAGAPPRNILVESPLSVFGFLRAVESHDSLRAKQLIEQSSSDPAVREYLKKYSYALSRSMAAIMAQKSQTDILHEVLAKIGAKRATGNKS